MVGCTDHELARFPSSPSAICRLRRIKEGVDWEVILDNLRGTVEILFVKFEDAKAEFTPHATEKAIGRKA
ncbi:MAG TPA: hypothetical protein VGZ00_09755 [Candidatus Baltobacteraceae bacterium]|nr:hypothetical protein [Candidatus Baltobacteraceae bacterium]